jgi:hypothetical protein
LAEWTLTAATAEPAVALPPGIVQGAPVLQLTRGAGGARKGTPGPSTEATPS